MRTLALRLSLLGLISGTSFWAGKNWPTPQKTTQLEDIDWPSLEQAKARKFLPSVLDSANIPHGDLAVPGNCESGRYTISRWQRGAHGAVCFAYAYDNEGDLCVALGQQRGQMQTAAGYREIPLPKNNTLGLTPQYSRLHAKTREQIAADVSIKQTAVRELSEEFGLEVNSKQLTLINVADGPEENPIVPTLTAVYAVFLEDTTPLQVKDHEFAADDLQRPQWYKIKAINENGGKHYVPGASFPIRRMDDMLAGIEKLNLETKKQTARGLKMTFVA